MRGILIVQPADITAIGYAVIVLFGIFGVFSKVIIEGLDILIVYTEVMERYLTEEELEFDE